jgi:hypothetical protein
VAKVGALVSQCPTPTRMVLPGIGEPLLNKELPQLRSYLKGAGKHVLLNSNATFLKTRWQQALVDDRRCLARGGGPLEQRTAFSKHPIKMRGTAASYESAWLRQPRAKEEQS